MNKHRSGPRRVDVTESARLRCGNYVQCSIRKSFAGIFVALLSFQLLCTTKKFFDDSFRNDHISSVKATETPPFSHVSSWNRANNATTFHWECTRFHPEDSRNITSQEWLPIPTFLQDQECFHNTLDRITFIHMGKAGGGTVETALKSAHIKYLRCHPYPCKGGKWKYDDKQRTALDEKDSQQHDLFITTIRDPVDRFVSAFNWRNIILKNPNRHDSKRISGALPERQVLSWYGENVSRLAEAFCDKNNSDEWNKALVASKSIQHLKYSLIEWLDKFFVVEQEGGSKGDSTTTTYNSTLPQLIFLVQERISNASTLSNFNREFAETADRALQYALTQYYSKRSRGEEGKKQQLKEIEADDNNSILDSEQQLMPAYWRIYDAMDGIKRLHTSKKSGKTAPPPLSILGECCLARFLSPQYHLLQSIITADQDTPTTAGRYRGSSAANTEGEEDDILLGRWKPESMISSSANLALDMRLVRACHWGTKQDKLNCQAGLRNMVKRRLRFLTDPTTPCENLIDSRQLY